LPSSRGTLTTAEKPGSGRTPQGKALFPWAGRAHASRSKVGISSGTFFRYYHCE
ncbi:hypothetical protein ANANG_G00215980, partial [Anguilla anguilla]